MLGSFFTRQNRSQNPLLRHLSTKLQFKSGGKNNKLTTGNVILGDVSLRLMFANESTELIVVNREKIDDCFPVLVLYSVNKKV